MSGTGGNQQGPAIYVTYTMPSSVPVALQPVIKPIYLALQSLIQTLINYCGIEARAPSAILTSSNDPAAYLAANVHRFYCIANEAIIQGAAVNLFNFGGSLAARNANATDNTKPAIGYCSQVGGLLSGQVGEFVLVDGMVTVSAGGLVPGAGYYLSTTPGAYTSVAPVALGNISQQLGFAVNSNTLLFRLGALVQN